MLGKDGTRSRTFQLLALVCLLLVAFAAVADAFHTHGNQLDATKCPLCIGSHTALLVAIVIALSALLRAEAGTIVASSAGFPGRIACFALSVRPPPSLS